MIAVVRPISRIPETLELLREVWLQVPDWRLGQLLVNLAGSDGQVWYLEDTTIAMRLRQVMNEGW